jgi:amino-acid N-acetyltransferase
MISPQSHSAGLRPTPVPARSEDWSKVRELLLSQGLPEAGAFEHLGSFVVIWTAGTIVGTAGVEVYTDAGLLRSVAVQPDSWKKGLGTLLTVAAVERARQLGVHDLYLLTTTATAFFQRQGFELVSRSVLPAVLGASRELQGACPASAVAMRRTIGARTESK